MNAEKHRFLHAELTEKIIGVFYEVYNELGPGLLESVYRRSMTIALQESQIVSEQEKAIQVWFRGKEVGFFRADILVEDKVILELKAVRTLDRAHEAILLNHLRATSIEVGLLLNFGPKPQLKRMVYDNSRKTKLRVPAKITSHSDLPAFAMVTPVSLRVAPLRVTRQASPLRRIQALGAEVISARPLSEIFK